MRYLVLSLVLAWACTQSPPVGAGQMLISEAEARLPSSSDTALTMRGLTRGPAVEQVSPDPGGAPVKSPLPLKIKFVTRNNAAIDPGSVKITYVKAPTIDLTARIKANITADGIELMDAEVPPGTHLLRVEVKDSQGRASAATIKLSIEK